MGSKRFAPAFPKLQIRFAPEPEFLPIIAVPHSKRLLKTDGLVSRRLNCRETRGRHVKFGRSVRHFDSQSAVAVFESTGLG